MSALNHFLDLAHGLHKAIPLSPHDRTMSECPSPGCTGSAAGSGHCVDCLTQRLGEIVGETQAKAYVELLRSHQRLYGELRTLSEVRGTESHP